MELVLCSSRIQNVCMTQDLEVEINFLFKYKYKHCYYTDSEHINRVSSKELDKSPVVVP